MQIGHSRRTLLAAALGAACALVPALFLWGFTVDDALIPVRYARHLAEGQGYRFDVGGAPTDGVTPLPWAPLLVPLAKAGAPLEALFRVKLVGLSSWALAAAALGARIARAEAGRAAKASAFVALACLFPVAAYAVSGMATGVATALATFAALSAARGRVRAGAALAGLSTAFRPELLPWAMVLSAGTALATAAGDAPETSRRARLALEATALSLAPFAACAALRFAFFGRAAPLALLAKPSDLAHGTLYASVALVSSVAPVLALAPFALARARGAALVLVAAAATHFAAMALAGGDWMPYFRLAVPVAPSLVYASVLLAPRSHPAAVLARAAVAALIGVALFATSASAARAVGADRAALVASAAPALAGARRVAALDVGWVSAAVADDVDIVDLAGVTDPAIAALPGGHTSKRIGGALLLERAPDVLLLYVTRPGSLDDYAGAVYPRDVEFALAHDPLVAARFTPEAWLPLGARGAGYVLLRAR